MTLFPIKPHYPCIYRHLLSSLPWWQTDVLRSQYNRERAELEAQAKDNLMEYHLKLNKKNLLNNITNTLISLVSMSYLKEIEILLLKKKLMQLQVVLI